MIKANELRIGNWVEDAAHNIVRVESLLRNSLFLAFGIEDNEADYSEVIGIPLTPEILEKAGFKISNDEYGGWLSKEVIREQPHSFLQLRIRYDEYGFYYDNTFVTRLASLHQLQNLYFALTGEELYINI